jgi:hypothetical protein
MDDVTIEVNHDPDDPEAAEAKRRVFALLRASQGTGFELIRKHEMDAVTAELFGPRSATRQNCSALLSTSLRAARR